MPFATHRNMVSIHDTTTQMMWPHSTFHETTRKLKTVYHRKIILSIFPAFTFTHLRIFTSLQLQKQSCKCHLMWSDEQNQRKLQKNPHRVLGCSTTSRQQTYCFI